MIPIKVAEKNAGLNIELKFGSGIKTRDIVILTRQFATMINSGLPLVQSLDILAKQSQNPSLRRSSSRSCSMSRPVTRWRMRSASTQRSSPTCT